MQNGILSALPFLSRYLGAITLSSLGDALTSRGYITVLTSRKAASVIGEQQQNPTVVVGYLNSSVTFSDLIISAFYIINETICLT